MTERLKILGIYLIGSLEEQREHREAVFWSSFLNSLYLSSWHNQECFRNTIDNAKISKEQTYLYWDYEIMDYDDVYFGKVVTMLDETCCLHLRGRKERQQFNLKHIIYLLHILLKTNILITV